MAWVEIFRTPSVTLAATAIAPTAGSCRSAAHGPRWLCVCYGMVRFHCVVDMVGRPCNAVNVRQQLVTVPSVLPEYLVPPFELCCSICCYAPECVPGNFSHVFFFQRKIVRHCKPAALNLLHAKFIVWFCAVSCGVGWTASAISCMR